MGSEPARLAKPFLGLLESDALGLFPAGRLTAREACAGVGTGDGGVVRATYAIGLHEQIPAHQFERPPREILSLHRVGPFRAFRPGRLPGCPTPSTSRRSSSRSDNRAGA